MNSVDDNDVTFIERFLYSFKTLGGNELGLIDFENFKCSLHQKNEAELKEVLGIIDREHHVKEDHLDFVSLCFSILSTKACFNRLSRENGRIVNSTQRINTGTYTRSKASNQISDVYNPNQEPTFPAENFCCKTLKGLIFNNEGDLLSYRCCLEILENSKIEICIEGVPINGENSSFFPIEILVFQDNKNTVFVTSSSTVDQNGNCTIKCTLRKGKYILVPILLKPWIKDQDPDDTLKFQSLLNIDDESNIVLTVGCISALRSVFNAIDIDGNGLLNQSEFDFFIRHTSGEPATDEWSTIEDNFSMENGELTFEGFLELYRMVLQTDPSDVINMFERMGMNACLELEKSQLFTLTVKSEVAKFLLDPLPVSSFNEIANKVLCKLAVEHGASSKVKKMNDLILFTQRLAHRATIVVQNQSHSKVTVRLDCNKSINCESHRERLDYSVDVPPRSSVIGHHLFPIDTNYTWTIDCSESLK